MLVTIVPKQCIAFDASPSVKRVQRLGGGLHPMLIWPPLSSLRTVPVRLFVPLLLCYILYPYVH